MTITRNPSRHWSSGRIITEEEWRAVALSEPGIRPPIDSDDVAPDDLVWTCHPQHPVVPIEWFDGQIDVPSPDEFTLALMARLAARLNAI